MILNKKGNGSMEETLEGVSARCSALSDDIIDLQKQIFRLETQLSHAITKEDVLILIEKSLYRK